MLCNLSCVLLIWEPPRRGTSNHFKRGTDDVPHVDAVCRELSTKGDVEGTQLSYIIIDALFDPGWEVLCHLLVS